ncbi:MAG: hypothetical protein IJM13_06590 [Lachnospiraceae bacterium]|nr:hypothetical protein [Lachnospiraceae bacterium]MBR0106867.1 hypothetical protein [Lachnospiraceae bacterium]
MDQDEKLIKLLSLLASDMQTIQNTMQALEKNQRTLQAVSENVEAEVRKIREDVTGTTGELRELTGRVQIMESQIADNTEAIRRYQMNESSLKSDINEILAAAEQSAENLEDSARNMRLAAGDITKISDDVLALHQETNKLGQYDEDIITSLSILRQDLEATKAELQATTMDTFSIKERLESIVATTDGVNAATEEQLHMLKGIDGKVSAYTESFFEISEEVKKNREGIPPIDQHVQELGITLSNMIADLEQIDERIDKHASRTEVSIELMKDIKGANDAFSSAMRSLI